MKAYTTKELKAILKLHQKWLNNEVDGTRANLTRANLYGANLTDANLARAILTGVDLADANLTNLLGNMKHIKTVQTDKYLVTYTTRVLQIGCKKHSIEEWKNFDDETILKMDSGALEWWAKWKPIIMQIIEMSPCEPTK